MHRTLVFALLAIAAPFASAQSHVYIGPTGACTNMGMTSTSWQCDLNWSAGLAPGANSTVSIGAATVTGVFSSATVLGLSLNGTNLQTGGSLQINDTFIWNGGSLATGGTINVVGVASLQGGGKLIFGTDLRTEGTGIINWVAGPLALDGNSAIDNRGTFDVQVDGATLSATNFINRSNALLTRTVGTGTAIIGAPIENQGGQIDVRSGTLQINGATLQGGVYTASAGATLHFSQFGAYTLSGLLAGNPAGSVILDNGQNTVSLDGTTTLNIGGNGLEWQDGFFTPAGETLTNTGLLVLTEFHNASDGVLRNEGTVRWEGGNNQLSAFTIENAGLFDLQGTGTFLGGGNNSQFVNQDGGTLVRSVGASDVNTNVPIVNQAGGTIDLAAGALFLSSNSSLDHQAGALLTGTGTLKKGSTNGVTFGGVVAPGASPGVLSWVGDASFPYDPAASAVLEIEIGGPTPGTQHDQLAVTGPAELGGTLRISLVNGFTPSENDRFQIITTTGGATTGAFDSMDLPAGMAAYVDVSATGAELVIGTPVAMEHPGPPVVLALLPASPNPVAAEARLRFNLPNPSHVELSVLDALGREVVMLRNGDFPTGSHEAMLDTSGLTSGVYAVRLKAGALFAVQRLTVAR